MKTGGVGKKKERKKRKRRMMKKIDQVGKSVRGVNDAFVLCSLAVLFCFCFFPFPPGLSCHFSRGVPDAVVCFVWWESRQDDQVHPAVEVVIALVFSGSPFRRLSRSEEETESG